MLYVTMILRLDAIWSISINLLMFGYSRITH